ncbi:MAG: hypothetical protein WBB68_01310 [Candidatus Moraniibacteriota bacterium]
MGSPMEQLSLSLAPKEAAESKPVDMKTATHEEILAALPELSRLELAAGYKRFVGKDPTFRELSDEELRTGIKDPALELERLARIDQEEDQEARRNYGRN